MTTDQADAFTTGAVAARLGVGTSMARRYGLALENVRGEPLQQVPGRGRIYTAADLRTLEDARSIMMQHPHLPVEDAIRRVLGVQPLPAPTGEGGRGGGRTAPTGDNTAIQIERDTWGALAGALEDLRASQAAILAEVRSMQRALPAPGVPLADDPVRLLEEYRRRVEDQQAELERLRRRPWWRFWR